ncbi:hypothetical protein Tco_1376979, partial [Tanacetum coccineum]
IPHGLTPREPTFQVVLDAVALTPCYPAFLITADVPEGREFDPLPYEEDTVSFLRELRHTREINSLNDVVVDQMHQPWRTFATLINQSLSGKTIGLDQVRLSRAQILWGMFHRKNVDYVELLWEDFIYQIENRVYQKQEKISKDDYLIKSLRFVFAKESSQIYGAILPECLTSPTMKESKAYKTYIGYATGEVPPKIARKLKKFSPTKKDSIVIKETPVKTKSTGKEKVDVSRRKGIDLLSEVALAEKDQLKEVRKKCLRDFHKKHPSGSEVLDVTEDDSTKSESESWGNDEDESKNEQEASDEGSGQENESEEQESNSEQDEESDDDNQE